MRNVLLKIHLWFGLTAAIFLVILGLTGSIMAFEGEIDHWLHPTLWYVAVSAHTLPEAELIGKVDRQFAPAQVSAVEFPRQPNLAEMMHLTDRSAVLINPYDGSILGRVMRPTKTQKVLGFIHQLHLRLAPDPRWPIAPVGKIIISYAGLILCLQVPTGVVLWLRAKRTSIRWNGFVFASTRTSR
jgi:uncharacterized iron-regulated membrane protein